MIYWLQYSKEMPEKFLKNGKKNMEYRIKLANKKVLCLRY